MLYDSVIEPVTTILDFQNIPYIYKSTDPKYGLDCFTLYNFIRYKFEREIVGGFDKYYVNPVHKEIPKEFLPEICVETFGEANGDFKTTYLPFILNDWYGTYGFSTVVKFLDKPYMITTSPSKGSSIFPLARFQGRIMRTWDLRTCQFNRLEKVNNFYGLDLC